MTLDQIRAEIAPMRVQIKRQQKDIASLQKAGIGTSSAVALLERMHDRVDTLGLERDGLLGQRRMVRQPAYANGKAIKGTPGHRRGL